MRVSSRVSTSLPRLYQTEWCPASQRVRQRLTELGLPYVAVPVSVERSERTALVAATGSDSIPALVPGDGAVLVGETAILGYLDGHYDEPIGCDRASGQGREGAPSPTGGGNTMSVGEQYAMTGATALGFEQAVARTREELETEGFGVLTEIDVEATMRAKLGLELEPYLILGACNPTSPIRRSSSSPTSASFSRATSSSTSVAERRSSRLSTRS